MGSRRECVRSGGRGLGVKQDPLVSLWPSINDFHFPSLSLFISKKKALRAPILLRGYITCVCGTAEAGRSDHVMAAVEIALRCIQTPLQR